MQISRAALLLVAGCLLVATAAAATTGHSTAPNTSHAPANESPDTDNGTLGGENVNLTAEAARAGGEGEPAASTDAPPGEEAASASGTSGQQTRTLVETTLPDAAPNAAPLAELLYGPPAPATPGSTDASPTTPSSPREGGSLSLLGQTRTFVPDPVRSHPLAWLGIAGLGLATVAALRQRGRSTSATSDRGTEEEGATTGAIFHPVPPPKRGVRFSPLTTHDPDTRTAKEGTTVTDEGDRPARTPVENPGVPGILLLGKQALEVGEPGLASAWFEVAIELEPRCAQAHLCLGVAFQAMGERSAAVEALQRAMDLDPGNALARLHLARCLVEATRTSEAIAALAPMTGTHREVDDALYEDPAFETLQDHPRFLSLVGRL